MFNKTVRYNNMRERNDILDSYMDNDHTLKGIKNITLTKNKNCYIDISNYMVNFFNFHRKSWKLTLSEFFKMVHTVIDKEEYNEFNSKIMLLNINCWDTDKVTVINKYNILNNPFSIIYLALRKNFSLVQSMGNIEIFITDGSSVFFKFNPLGVDKSSYLDFKLCLSKIKPSLLEKDLDNDAHLDTYGTTSSNAPKEELDKAKAELHAAENVAAGDEEVKMSLMDEMDRISSNIDTDNVSSDEDDDTNDEDDELETGEDEEDEAPEGERKESEEEKEDRLEQELLAELNVDDDTAAAVHKVLSRKVPDKPVSARERKLKEQQLQLKLESGKTLSEILDQAKNNPSFKTVNTTNIDDKISTINKSVTKVTFPNFEKSYNDEVFEHDFYGVFNSLSEKSDLPIYIRKITKEDTSDSLNLKETYTFELEDPEYHRRMTFKIDVPKFVEGKFMYLSGNKKMFVKQLILKPVVKIAQDTVQICSNYSKIFMHRYGDNVSPVTQNIIKILSSNTKYFTVTKGNAIPLNAEYKTALEYDAIAKYLMTVKIKNSKITFFFSQKHLDEYIKEHHYEDLLKEFDRDRLLIIGLDETDPKQPKLIEMNTDDADIAAADFNNGEDIDPGPITESAVQADFTVKRNIVDTILEYAHMYNPSFDISNLLTETGIKTSKKYIFSRCVIMKKNVPTIFLLSYAEGLTTVLRKANIKYTFQEARPKFENNYAKLEQGVIPFANGYLVFDRYPIQNSLLMNAFAMIDTRAYDFEDMDKPDVFADIFSMLYGARQLASAFDAFYDNMIDPITKEMLESMNYPTTFVPLLIFANNLLCDNSYTTEINMNNFRVRSNEMVNAMLYKIVARAYSNYKRTAMNRQPMTISVPRGALIKEIVTNQSVEDYSRLNPILEADKSRAVTCKGPSGINLEQSYTEEKRCFDKTMTGLLAMATSPDGNCGVVRQLTVDPKIKSPRGFIDTDKPIDGMTEAELFCASDMAIPGAARSDDSIRTSMMFKQN